MTPKIGPAEKKESIIAAREAVGSRIHSAQESNGRDSAELRGKSPYAGHGKQLATDADLRVHP
ncbi:hypothetical protein [Pseudorhodoplanes sp.]|uniref:hypothetical protein n=1 Tax=Pseudorhodoplanes sp. TaxID=1934341 RepID=UPI002D7FD275|nr:hypothetical protein [Pseudorhodoplanes sp.]